MTTASHLRFPGGASCFARKLFRMCIFNIPPPILISPLESTKGPPGRQEVAPVTPLESALTKRVRRKFFRMCSYINQGEGVSGAIHHESTTYASRPPFFDPFLCDIDPFPRETCERALPQRSSVGLRPAQYSAVSSRSGASGFFCRHTLLEFPLRRNASPRIP